MIDEPAGDMTRSAMARTAATWPRHREKKKRRRGKRSNTRRQRASSNQDNGSDRV